MLSPFVLHRCTLEISRAFVGLPSRAALLIVALALFLSKPWGSHHLHWWGQLQGSTENFLKNTVLINALCGSTVLQIKYSFCEKSVLCSLLGFRQHTFNESLCKFFPCAFFFFPNSLAIDLFWWVFSLILFQKKGIHIELAEMLANVELVFT